MKNPLNILIIIGLALGGLLGMAGTMVPARNLQAAFWAVDGVGIIVATTLLALKYFRTGNDCVAAGFLVFAIGESIMLSGTATTLEASVPSFAAGTALWSAGLLLASVPKQFAIWIRVIGGIASVLFAITAGRIFWGEPLLPTSQALPSYAYPFLVLTFAGWIWTALEPPAMATAQAQAGTAGEGTGNGVDGSSGSGRRMRRAKSYLPGALSMLH